MTSTASLFKALIAAIALGHCHAAIPWRTVNCDGATLGGKSIDAVWGNAREMAQNAGSAISKVVSASAILPRSETSRIADNAKALFGISFGFSKATGLPSAAKTTMNTVKAVFDDVATQLGTTNGGYLWCGDSSFVFASARDPQLDYLEAWQYPIPGTADVLVLAGQTGGNIRPCAQASGNLMGETLRGQYRTTVGPNLDVQTNDVMGIVLCVDNLQNYIANKGWKATLTQGYDTGTFVKPGPDPDAYSSASGTLVHEMVHFRNWNYYTDQIITENGKNVQAYRYARAHTLAKNAANSDGYLKNPDNYRIFAEMSMSPATKWGAAKPAGVSKRSKTRRSSGPVAVEERDSGPVIIAKRDSLPLLELEVRNATSLVNGD